MENKGSKMALGHKGFGRIFVEKEEDIQKVKDIIREMDEYEFDYLPDDLIAVFSEENMKDEFSIGSSSMRRMTKQELIDAINKTFSDDCGMIAVITECESTNPLNGDKTLTQSVTFGKMLELNA